MILSGPGRRTRAAESHRICSAQSLPSSPSWALSAFSFSPLVRSVTSPGPGIWRCYWFRHRHQPQRQRTVQLRRKQQLVQGIRADLDGLLLCWSDRDDNSRCCIGYERSHGLGRFEGGFCCFWTSSSWLLISWIELILINLTVWWSKT